MPAMPAMEDDIMMPAMGECEMEDMMMPDMMMPTMDIMMPDMGEFMEDEMDFFMGPRHLRGPRRQTSFETTDEVELWHAKRASAYKQVRQHPALLSLGLLCARLHKRWQLSNGRELNPQSKATEVRIVQAMQAQNALDPDAFRELSGKCLTFLLGELIRNHLQYAVSGFFEMSDGFHRFADGHALQEVLVAQSQCEQHKGRCVSGM